MEEHNKKIEEEINTLHERNRRVEADKAWETSAFHIGAIMVITYFIASIILYTIGVKKYLLNALLPAIGYFLSTQSLPQIKEWWIKKYFRS